MRVFWWSDPMSPVRQLRTATMEGGQHGPIDILNQFDVEVALLIAQQDAKEISWQTAQVLGWPT